MKYKFYGKDSPSVKPINEQYSFIIDQRHLYDLLKECWSKDTCAPRMRERWSEDNYTLGQCSITAFLVQDIFGGLVYGVPLEDGNFHCFNVIGKVVFDLTSEQFSEPLNYESVILQKRDDHFNKKEKYDRYILLRNRLLEITK